MKKVLLTIVFAVLTMSTAIFAQELTVVIAPFNVRAGFSAEDAETIYELFLMELAKHRSATLKVLDQRDRSLGEIINRMKFENSDWSDTKKVTEFGVAANANAVVMGTMMVLGGQRIITGQILDVRSTEILSTSRMDVQNVTEVLVKLPDFTKEIVSHLPKPPPPIVGKWKCKFFNNSNSAAEFVLEFRSDGTFFGTGYESKTATGYWESDNRLSNGKYEAILKNTYDGGGGIAKEEYKLIKGTISGTYTFTSSIIYMSYNISGSLETQSLIRETRSYGSSYGEQISTTSHSDQGNFSIPYTISQDGKTLTIGQHPVFLKSVKNNYAPQPAIYYSEFLKE